MSYAEDRQLFMLDLSVDRTNPPLQQGTQGHGAIGRMIAVRIPPIVAAEREALHAVLERARSEMAAVLLPFMNTIARRRGWSTTVCPVSLTF